MDAGAPPPSTPEPPAELSVGEAAQLLNVDRKTVKKYILGGSLEYRNIAPPGSIRPTFRITKRSALALRNDYHWGGRPVSPVGRRPRAPKPDAIPTRLKHLVMDRSAA